MAPKMEFFKGAQNFTMGNVEFNTVQGDYHDYSVRNVRNTYGNRNRYYTNNANSFNDYSNNYGGDYHAPSSHYHGTVNNIERVQNANFGDNYGTFNQGTTTQVGGGGSPPPPTPPVGPGYAQGPPSSRPGLVPGDRDFTASSTAIPQHQGYQQQRGPPPPSPVQRPPSGPPMPEGNQAWQQQQQGPPPAFPPAGPQGYPQHPPQNPTYRPPNAPFPPPPQQSQPQQQQQPPPPQQQQQRQGSEQWPGQYAYKQGMAHLKQTSPSGLDLNSTGSSDSSDEDGSETDRPPMRKSGGGQRRNPNSKRMEDPSRADNVGGGSGALGASISIAGGNVAATAAGGARMTMNYGAVGAPVSPQGAVFNQGSQYAASPAAPPSRGRTPQPEYPPAPRGDPSPASRRGPSPQPAPQQRPQRAPSPAPASVPAPAAAPETFLSVPPREAPLSGLVGYLAAGGDNRRRSVEMVEVDDDDATSLNDSPPDKKKKKHRNPFSFLSSSKKK